MDRQRKIWLLLLAVIVAIGTVSAAVEYTQTAVGFNIASTVAYTLTLPGESATNSDPSAASAATTQIDFNSTTGDEKAVNAKVAGGTTQSDGTAIFQFDNTGTVNLTLTLYLNDSMPSCITLLGKSTWSAVADGASIIGVANTTIDSEFGVAEAAQDYYLWANFSNCQTGNHRRLIYTSGYE